MKQMSKVIIMAVMLVISISANAALASAMEGLDIEFAGDTAYSNADLSIDLMYSVDVEPVLLDRIDRVAPIAELRHSAGRAQFKAKTAKLPNPPRNYRQPSEVGWRS